MNRASHGFYRFFAFEGILSLVCLNLPFWFSDPFSLNQILSWSLLAISVALVINGLFQLKTKGGSGRKNALKENFAFENTTSLVESGIYKYIRHPMYSSLLFLAWGIFFKQSTALGACLAFFTTASLIATARSEEIENCDFFGPVYKKYMKRSKMFVPKLF